MTETQADSVLDLVGIIVSKAKRWEIYALVSIFVFAFSLGGTIMLARQQFIEIRKNQAIFLADLKEHEAESAEKAERFERLDAIVERNVELAAVTARTLEALRNAQEAQALEIAEIHATQRFVVQILNNVTGKENQSNAR